MKYIGVILIFNTIMCYSQDDRLNLNENTMKKFDLNDFKDLPLPKCTQADYYRHYMTDTERVSILFSHKSADIIVTREGINTPYGSVEIYSEKTKLLMREGKKFALMQIGIWKDYNENGELIKETNYDSGFISLDSLIVKLKKEYDIDILKGALTTHRAFANHRPFYEITYKCPECDWPEYLLLDGDTGVLLFRKVVPGDEGFGDAPYNLYLKHLTD